MEDDLEYFITFPTPAPHIPAVSPSGKSCSKAQNSSSTEADPNNETNPYTMTNAPQVSSQADEGSEGGVQPSAGVADITLTTTAPSPTDLEDEEDEEDGRVGDMLPYFGGGVGKEPVVLLLGWLGAKDKHLAKYASLYTAQGCIVMRYTAPPSYRYFADPEGYLGPLATRLVAVLREMALHTHPLLCHAFSQYGATLYYYVSEAVAADAVAAGRENGQGITLTGCVFDSCPAPRRILSGVYAVYAVAGGSVWRRLVYAAVVWAYLIGWTALSLAAAVTTGGRPRGIPWSLVQERRRVPQLFLYSWADRLVSACDVEQFWRARRNRGVAVTAKIFRDSPHVQHYRCHPEEYTKTVFQFLWQCLTQPQPQSLPQLQPLEEPREDPEESQSVFNLQSLAQAQYTASKQQSPREKY